MNARPHKLGWIGIGRMGYAMAERLAKSGADLTVWNRTRAKAEPLALVGAKLALDLNELAACDIVFVMVSTWDDVREVIDGPRGLLSGDRAPKMVIECSSISLEGSAELRASLSRRGVQMLAAPVSGNAKVIKAGRLSFVCSGPKAAFDAALPALKLMGRSASYVGDGELARIVKICHNVFLGVVIQSLAEITVLAQKAGVPRARVPRLHQPERDGLDLLALQDAGAGQPGLPRSPSRRSCCARTWTSASMPRARSRCRCRWPRSRATWCRA